MSSRAWRGLAARALAGAIAIGIVAAIVSVSGSDVGTALGAAFRGSVGSPFAVFSGTLKRATPLMLLGISVAIAFRAGVLNIGGEGQFLIGAAAGVAAGLGLPVNLPSPIMIAAEVASGVVAGALWAGVAA